MIKKLVRYLKVVPIDVRIYSMTAPIDVAFPEIPYPLKTEPVGERMRFSMDDNGKFVHQSFLFPKLRLLKLIRATGPAIGDCVTSTDYRGQSIYPYVINKIACEYLNARGVREMFIVVNDNNIASIKGIEKAGFTLRAHIKAKRFLAFYFDKKITRR